MHAKAAKQASSRPMLTHNAGSTKEILHDRRPREFCTNLGSTMSGERIGTSQCPLAHSWPKYMRRYSTLRFLPVPARAEGDTHGSFQYWQTRPTKDANRRKTAIRLTERQPSICGNHVDFATPRKMVTKRRTGGIQSRRSQQVIKRSELGARQNDG